MQNLHNLHNSKLELYFQFLIGVIAFIALYQKKINMWYFFSIQKSNVCNMLKKTTKNI
jgi:hypothetical protein